MLFQGKTRQIGQFQREKELATARLREKETFPEPELMWVKAREVERLREKELEKEKELATVMVREPEPEAWCRQ